VVASSTSDPSVQGSARVTVLPGASTQPDLYFPFDEGTGTTTWDASGHNVSISFINGPAWVPGKFGTALGFQNNPLAMGIPNSTVSLGGNWSVACWVSLPANADCDLITCSNSLINVPLWSFLSVSGSELGCFGPGGYSGYEFYSSGFLVSSLAQGWHHIAAVGTGGSTTFYVDGQVVGNPVPVQVQGSIYSIGNGYYGRTPVSSMDDLRIYYRALGPQDVAAIPGQGLSIIPAQAFLMAGGRTQFFADVPGDPSNSVTWSLAGSNLGTLTPAGVYTAPPVLPAGVTLIPVIAHSTANPAVTGGAWVQLVDPTPGMVGYWKFDEGQGSAVQDASGNGNNGLLSGAASWVPGKEGNALAFAGTGANVVIPTLNAFQSAFSVTAWVKFDAVNRGIDNPILGFGTAGFNHGLQLCERAGKACFGFFDNDLSGNTVLVPNQWTHLAFVYDGQNKMIYVNGQLDITQVPWWPFQGQGAGTDLQLGAYPWATVPNQGALAGTLDEVRVYNTAISPTEVAAIYNGTVNIVLAPVSIALATGQSQVFTATVSGSTNQTVIWSLPDPQSGTITPAGLYIAPATVPYPGVTYHVTATSQFDPTQSTTVGVQVGLPLQILPQAPTVPTLGSIAFAVTSSGQYSPAVTWSVQESGGGTISQGGLYSAPAMPGAYHVVATTTSVPVQTVSALVTVMAGSMYGADGPILYLPLDEGFGTITMDASGYNHPPASLVNGPTWVPGKFNWGLAFTNPTSQLTISPAVPLDSAWTLGAWIQVPLPVSSTPHVVASGSAFGDSQIMVASDQVSLGSYSGVQQRFWSSGFSLSTLGAGWHHLAAVGVGGTTQFFVDGVPVGNLIPWQSADNVCLLGNSSNAGEVESFGTLDEVRVYNRAMGPAELAGLFLAAVNVTASPAAPSLILGQSLAFAAGVTGTANQAVTWELPQSNSGSITSGGVYTAPATIPADGTVYTVVARSQADPTQTANIPVTVHYPVIISPAVTTVPLNDTFHFTVVTYNLASPTVTWSCTGGAIDANGNYTAPALGGLYTITATSVSDPTKTGTAQVYVPLVVTILPNVAGILTGGMVAYLATVSGSSNPGVAWSVVEPMGGTISQAGLYQAPTQPGVFHVNATSLADPNAGSMATVTVVADNIYSVQPASTTLYPGSQANFHLEGLEANLLPVTWQASGGSISTAGVYTAPLLAGTYTIMASFTPDIPRFATATVVVSPTAYTVTVSVSPGQVDLAPNGIATFTASVQGTTNTAVSWSCSGGSIDQTGKFTAPASGGTCTVTATSQDGSNSVGLATVTVTLPAAPSPVNCQYDLNGNLVSDGARTFEWDADNRLVSVTILATGHRSEFGYDGMGRRVQIRELDPDTNQNLQVTSDKKYLWDGAEIAEARTTDGGTVLQRYFRQGFVDTDGAVLFYTFDHLGSIRELTDGTQTVQARFDYDPYGNMTQVSGTRTSFFGYAGLVWHPASKLNLALFREYDPSLGCWLSRDPLGEFGGTNLYKYAMGMVIDRTDVLGLCQTSTAEVYGCKLAFITQFEKIADLIREMESIATQDYNGYMNYLSHLQIPNSRGGDESMDYSWYLNNVQIPEQNATNAYNSFMAALNSRYNQALVNCIENLKTCFLCDTCPKK